MQILSDLKKNEIKKGKTFGAWQNALPGINRKYIPLTLLSE